MGKIVYKPHLFKRDEDQHYCVESGTATIQALVEEASGEFYLTSYASVTLNGQLIPKKYWKVIKPKDAELIIAIHPHGSDSDNKDILRLVAVVALTVATGGALAGSAGFLGLSAGVGAQIAAGATMILGTLAISAIFAPPLPPEVNNEKESPSLSFSGQRNRIAPNAPVPRVYGKHKVFPINAAAPYTQTGINDTQYLYMLLDFGYGPLVLRDHKIGENPLTQYTDVKMVYHREILNGNDLKLYTKDVKNQVINIELKQNQPVIKRTDVDCDSCQLDFTYPIGIAYYDENGARRETSISHSLYFREVGTSTWLNLSDAQTYDSSRGDVRMGFVGWGYNNTSNATSLNVAATTVEENTTRVKVLGRPYIIENDYDVTNMTGVLPELEGYPEGSTEIDVVLDSNIFSGNHFHINSERYTVTEDYNAGANTIKISPPLKSDLITSATQVIARSGNQAVGTNGSVENSANVTGWEYGGNINRSFAVFEVTDSTAEPVTYQLNLGFAKRSQYEIKVDRNFASNPEASPRKIFDTSVWAGMRTITNRSPFSFDTPHTMVELRIKATDQLSGVVDNYSAIASSVLKVHNGVSFDELETSNPAWIVYDILTGTANPQPLAADKINLNKFISWANFCASQAGNAVESMLRCDVVIDYKTTVIEIVRQVMSTGRGSLAINNGKYSVIYDEEPTIPVQLITPHNSSGFSGERLFAGEPHAIRVTFVDGNSGWQQREVIVYNDGFDAANSENYQDLELFGVTRFTQAWRDGRYFLAQAILRQESFTVNMDLENIVFERGDYIQLQHDVARIGGAPSRVRSVSGNTITTTEPIEFSPNPQNVRIREANNLMQTYSVVNYVDAYSIELSGNNNIMAGDLLVYGEVDLVTDDFLVSEILPRSDLNAVIKLVPLARPVYNSDTGVIPPYSAKISPDVSLNPPLVQSLTATEEVIFLDRKPYINLYLEWTDLAVNVTAFYQVYLYIGDQYKLVGTVEDRTFAYYREHPLTGINGQDIKDRVHKFKVIAVSVTGKKVELEKATSVSIVPFGDATPPPRVKNFSLDLVSHSIELSWASSGIEDSDGFIIRYSPSVLSPAWETSTVAAAASWDNFSIKLNARIGSYLIKERDTSGNLSADASIIITQIPELVDLNVIKEIDEAPDWLGTLFNMERLGPELRNVTVVANPNLPPAPQEYAQESSYQFLETVDLGDVYESRITAKVNAYGASKDDLMINWVSLSSVDALQSAGSDLWNTYLEMRTSSTTTFISDWVTLNAIDPIGNIDDALFTEWKRFNVADVTARYMQFGIKCISNGFVRVNVSNALVEIDMPDRIESDSNIQSGTGGKLISFLPEFAAVPSVAITMENAVTGDYFVVTNKSRTNFTVEFFDSAGTSIDRLFDWYAKGYGRQRAELLPPTIA